MKYSCVLAALTAAVVAVPLVDVGTASSAAPKAAPEALGSGSNPFHQLRPLSDVMARSDEPENEAAGQGQSFEEILKMLSENPLLPLTFPFNDMPDTKGQVDSTTSAEKRSVPPEQLMSAIASRVQPGKIPDKTELINKIEAVFDKLPKGEGKVQKRWDPFEKFEEAETVVETLEAAAELAAELLA